MTEKSREGAAGAAATSADGGGSGVTMETEYDESNEYEMNESIPSAPGQGVFIRRCKIQWFSRLGCDSNAVTIEKNRVKGGGVRGNGRTALPACPAEPCTAKRWRNQGCRNQILSVLALRRWLSKAPTRVPTAEMCGTMTSKPLKDRLEPERRVDRRRQALSFYEDIHAAAGQAGSTVRPCSCCALAFTK